MLNDYTLPENSIWTKQPPSVARRITPTSWLLTALVLTILSPHAAIAGQLAGAVLSFNIPAQSLSSALITFGRQASVSLSVPSDLPPNLMSRPLAGRFTTVEALRHLLDGSSLTFKIIDPETIRIVRQHPTAARDDRRIVAKRKPERWAALPEVMVTAQKRDQPLEKVPIAVTVLSGTELANQRITDIQEVARLTPGLTISSYSYSKPDISLRGSYNNVSQIGVDTPVAVMLDGVFISRPSGQVFDLYDLQSVQVLRGPQGTLFGRNVTGGVIVLTTSKPSFTDTQYSGEIGYGNYDEVEANALVSGPIDDNIAAKLVVSHSSHDGYGHDRLTGRPEDDLDSSDVRAQFRVRSSSVQSLFTADYSRDSNGGRTLVSLGAGSVGNPRVSELGVDQYFKRHMAGVSNSTTWAIPGDDGTVTAITAYRTLDMSEVFSQSGVSYLFLTSGSQSIYNDANNVKDFSEETRYTSPKWRYGNLIAGMYYLNEDATEPLYITNLAAQTGRLVGSTTAYQAVTTNSISGYIDGTINLPDNFRLTLGDRYTYDSKTASLNYINALNVTRSFVAGNLSRNWTRFTPRAVLSWDVNDNDMIYASVTKGFTSGGFDTGDTTKAAVMQGFQPETVTSYETGVKSSFLQRRVTGDLAVFDMAFHNKQEFVFNTLTGIGNITNAAQATSKGAELEIGIRPIHDLALNLGYAYLDTYYNNFVVPGLFNYTGHALGYSPRHKASVTLHYERPLSDLGFANANLSYAWTDTYDITASTTQLAVPQYGLADANISYETPDMHYRVALWGKNLFNRTYELVASTTGTLAEYYGAPRTFGITLSVNF